MLIGPDVMRDVAVPPVHPATNPATEPAIDLAIDLGSNRTLICAQASELSSRT